MESIPKGYGKITKDTDGNVIRVEFGGEEVPDIDNAVQDEIRELQDPEVDKQVIANWVTELGGGRGSGADVVKCKSAFSFCPMLLFRTFSSLRPFRRREPDSRLPDYVFKIMYQAHNGRAALCFAGTSIALNGIGSLARSNDLQRGSITGTYLAF